MSALIEVGRLAAVDLGKRVVAGGLDGVLVGVEHFLEDDNEPWTAIRLELVKHERYRRTYFATSTLVEVTGKPSKESA